MKKLLLALSVAVSVFFGGVEYDIAAAAPKCAAETEQDFMARVEKLNAKILIAKPDTRDKIMEMVNGPRIKKKLFLYEADKIAIGLFNLKGVSMVGIAWFKDGCYVPGTAEVMPSKVFAQIMEAIKVQFEGWVRLTSA